MKFKSTLFAKPGDVKKYSLLISELIFNLSTKKFLKKLIKIIIYSFFKENEKNFFKF